MKQTKTKLFLKLIFNNIVPLSTVACKSLGTPCRICENVNNFNKIREIIQMHVIFI